MGAAGSARRPHPSETPLPTTNRSWGPTAIPAPKRRRPPVARQHPVARHGGETRAGSTEAAIQRFADEASAPNSDGADASSFLADRAIIHHGCGWPPGGGLPRCLLPLVRRAGRTPQGHQDPESDERPGGNGSRPEQETRQPQVNEACAERAESCHAQGAPHHHSQDGEAASVTHCGSPPAAGLRWGLPDDRGSSPARSADARRHTGGSASIPESRAWPRGRPRTGTR